MPTTTKTKKEKDAEKKAKKQAQEKKEREAARKVKQEEKDAARKAERQEAIDSGALIPDGDFEFHLVDKDGETGTVEDRADAVLKAIAKSKVPVVGKELQDEHGGGWPQYLSFFSMLKVQGMVTEYRRRGGARGSSGVAYLATDKLRELV